MSFTVVNEWWFRKDADIEEAKEAAAELVDISISMSHRYSCLCGYEDHEDPLHHFHITVLDDRESLVRLRESDGIRRFIEKFWPHIIRDETYKSPSCDVWLCKVNNLKEI